MPAPEPVILCFDKHAADGKVGGIRQGRRWTRHTKIYCLVAIEDVYRPGKRQPVYWYQPLTAVYVDRFRDGTAIVREATVKERQRRQPRQPAFQGESGTETIGPRDRFDRPRRTTCKR